MEIERLKLLKRAVRQMVMIDKTIIREEGEPVWVENVLSSLQATGRKDEAEVLEELIARGLVRPGTRFDEFAVVMRKLMSQEA
jgi:hypothetical protein